MAKVTRTVTTFMSTAAALLPLICASAIATDSASPSTGESVHATPAATAAAEHLMSDIRQINSRLGDPGQQKYTDVSEAVKTYIPIGSTFAEAEALLLAMKCEPPLRMTAEEAQHLHYYRRSGCTSI